MNKQNVKKRNKTLRLQQPTETNELRNNAFLGLLIFYTLLLFYRCLSYKFVNWDDPSYITENELIRNFSFQGFKNIFTTPIIGMYNPIPFVVYAFEYKFWGLNPKIFHLSNIIFHLIAIIVLYKFIYRLSNRFETAIIVAVLFAIHPMHAGVVIWASQIKTSLYLIFYFSGLSCYLLYIKNNYKIKYLVYASFLFVCSVLSKPSAVTFAPMLFLLDYYLSRKPDRRLFLEKIPFFAIALLFGIITLLTHKVAGDDIFETRHPYSFINSILVSNYSIAFYIEKLFVPINLSTIYPYPENTPLLPLRYYLTIPVIPAILWLIYRSGSFRKEMIFGVLFFIISISVLVRIIPSGLFGTANRYTYLSYTGPFFVIAQFFVYVFDNKFTSSASIKKYAILLLCFFLVFYSWRTTRRIKVWENSITLFDDVIKKAPKLSMAYTLRAMAKKTSGNYDGAIQDMNNALRINPGYIEGYVNRGMLRAERQDYNLAIHDFDKALALDPNISEVRISRGAIQLILGNYKEAKTDFDLALKTDPLNREAYFNRASAKESLKDVNGAIADLTKAIELDPAQAETYEHRAMLMLQLNKSDEAFNDLSKALALKPDLSNCYNNRGNIEFARGNYLEAIADYNNAIFHNPYHGKAYFNRGMAKISSKDTSGALADWHKSAKLGTEEAFTYLEMNEGE